LDIIFVDFLFELNPEFTVRRCKSRFLLIKKHQNSEHYWVNEYDKSE